MKQSKKSIKKSNSTTSFRIKLETEQSKNTYAITDKMPARRKTLESYLKIPDFTTKRKFDTPSAENYQKQIDRLKDQIHLLNRVNQSLTRQNQTLKKEVAYLNQINSSRRSSFYSKKGNEEAGYKDKILSRLNNKRDGLVTMDNESTAMYSSKMTISKSEDSVSQTFEDFSRKRVVPSMEYLYRVTKRYFDQFKQNYVKLKVMFDHIDKLPKTDCSKKIEDLLCLFQVPILYRENPKGLFRSISKDKLQDKKAANKQKQIESSHSQASQVLLATEAMLKKIMKNSKLFERFKSSEIFYKLIKKCKS